MIRLAVCRMRTATIAMVFCAAGVARSLYAQGTVPPRDTVYLRLSELVRNALQENLEFHTAASESRAAQSYYRAVRSPFDPVLSISAEPNTRQYGGQFGGALPTGAGYLLGTVSSATVPGEPLYQNSLVLSVTQPLLRGIGYQSISNRIHAVDEGIAASRARLARVRDQVIANVTELYAVLVERQKQELIAERSLTRAEGLRDNYDTLRVLQQITEVDLVTAKLGVASRRATLLEFQRDRQAAQDALVLAVYGARAATMLRGEGAVMFARDSVTAMADLPPLDSAVARALAARQDVEAARRGAAQARFQSAYARNAVRPTVNLTGALTSTLTDSLQRATGDPSRTELGTFRWSLGVVFSRPLRNSASNAELERVAESEIQARIALTDAENIVRADVRAAYRDIRTGQEQSRLATEAAGLANTQYALERERLKLGLTDIFRVLQYEEQVSQVERAEAQAWLALATATARYKAALGVAAAEYR
jgi:outer membrane protein TolC